MKRRATLGKQLGMPVVLEEDFVLPNGARAKIRVHHGKRYGAMLRLSNGTLLPISADGDTAYETLQAAKRWLTRPVYGGN